MVTVEISSEKYRDTLNALHDALIGAGQMGDAATMMEDEARLFLKQAITLTPPRGLGGNAQKQGEAAIKRDLMKIMTPVNEEFLNVIGSQFGTTGIDAWFTSLETRKDVNVQWDRIDATGSGIPAWHHQHQDGRGHTRSLKRRAGAWYSPYVVAFQDFAAYLAKLGSHVGKRKAGWAVSFVSVGGKVGRWIGRHLGGHAPGAVFNQLSDPHRPSITMINRAPGITGDSRLVRDTMRVRGEAIAKRIKLIMSGYAKDVRDGIRPRKQVHRQTAPSL